MIKFLAVFVTGASLGVGTTLLVTEPPMQTVSHRGDLASTLSKDTMQTRQAALFEERLGQLLESLETVVADLRRSTAALASANDTPSPAALRGDQTAMDSLPATPPTPVPVTSKSSPPSDPVPPSTEQIEQYNIIQSRLYEAANNHQVALGELVKLGAGLTPAQRAALTREALEMIKRGELKAEQFSR